MVASQQPTPRLHSFFGILPFWAPQHQSRCKVPGPLLSHQLPSSSDPLSLFPRLSPASAAVQDAETTSSVPAPKRQRLAAASPSHRPLGSSTSVAAQDARSSPFAPASQQQRAPVPQRRPLDPSASAAAQDTRSSPFAPITNWQRPAPAFETPAAGVQPFSAPPFWAHQNSWKQCKIRLASPTLLPAFSNLWLLLLQWHLRRTRLLKQRASSRPTSTLPFVAPSPPTSRRFLQHHFV